MQANQRRSTGIEDHTGKDIKHGDIMDVNDSGHATIKGVVDFRGGKWVLGQTRGRSDELSDAVTAGYTVIGNVKDNPELLQVEEDDEF